jgi:hypothetical protein
MYFKSRRETFRASAVTVHLLNTLLLEIHYVFIMRGISNTMGHFFLGRLSGISGVQADGRRVK